MNNVFLRDMAKECKLDRKLKLHNGSIVILKNGTSVNGVYYVVSFRDNNNKYPNQSTGNYCSLVDLDSGNFDFEERCSRDTTVRRVLKHLLGVGYSNSRNRSSKEIDYMIRDYDIEIYNSGDYRMDIQLKDLEVKNGNS